MRERRILWRFQKLQVFVAKCYLACIPYSLNVCVCECIDDTNAFAVNSIDVLTTAGVVSLSTTLNADRALFGIVKMWPAIMRGR